MASGRLGAASLAANTLTTIYTVPGAKQAALSVNVCNRGASSAAIRVALASSDTPTDAEWIEYDVQVAANGVLERTGIMLEAGKKLVAYSNSASVSVVAYGIEEMA